MKINFSDIDTFTRLEDEATDGKLNYDDFPPEEYKYFSKLARLGYLNRHKGWDVDICTEKQDEYRTQYSEEKAHANRFVAMFKRINDGLVKTDEQIGEMYKASTEKEMLELAIQVIEKLTDENGFADRMNRKLEVLRNDKI